MESATKGETAIGLAVAAWLLALTSLWLPWWLVRYTNDQGVRYENVGVWLFRPTEELSTAWAPHLTGALVAAFALWLFVRVAGRSWHHEPGLWRRDLWVLAGGAALTLVSALLWPDSSNFPSFWGGRTFTDTASGASFTETTLPGLGWWCMALAFVALVVAASLARSAADASDK